jgi:hypothetical protein
MTFIEIVSILNFRMTTAHEKGMLEPQLLLRSKTRYYSRGSIIADSREDASGLLVITAGQVTILDHRP